MVSFYFIINKVEKVHLTPIPKLSERLEGALFWILFSLIILPIRISMFYLSHDHWYGIVGVLFSIMTAIIILSKKEKMGWFGRLFIKHIFKLHSGKKRFFVYGTSLLIISCAGLTLYLVNEGNSTYEDIKDLVYAKAKDNGMDLKVKQDVLQSNPGFKLNSNISKITLEDAIQSLSVALAIMDSAFDGWVVYFWTTILVTESEFVGVLLITKKFSQNNKKSKNIA